MAVKRFETRICNKTDSVASLTPASGAIVPLKGEIVFGHSSSSSSNSQSDPYIMKVGDGTHTWAELPAIGPCVFNGSAAISTNPSGDGNQVITVNIPADKKTYSKYVFAEDIDDTLFTVQVSGGPYMHTEHYLLFDNSQTAYDRYFNGIHIYGIDDNNIRVQKDWVSAYDIVEIKISIYSINGTTYATVTCTPGIVNAGASA